MIVPGASRPAQAEIGGGAGRGQAQRVKAILHLRRSSNASPLRRGQVGRALDHVVGGALGPPEDQLIGEQFGR